MFKRKKESNDVKNSKRNILKISVYILRLICWFIINSLLFFLIILFLSFQEMTVPLTPLTAIAQTPRKEQESKFTFNPHLAKVRIDQSTHLL